MVVNFKAHRISRGTRKLIRTPILIKNNNNNNKNKKLSALLSTRLTFLLVEFLILQFSFRLNITKYSSNFALYLCHFIL